MAKGETETPKRRYCYCCKRHFFGLEEDFRVSGHVATLTDFRNKYDIHRIDTLRRTPLVARGRLL